MSATQPNPRYQYSEMSETQARTYLVADYGFDEVEKWRNWNHIKNYADVLYYADAYGELSDAILLQGFDKTLPQRAHKALLDSDLDIFEAVDCHDMETRICPSCDSEMWEFGIYQGDSHTSRHWVDEYGNTKYDHVTFVSSTDGPYWNPDPGENASPILCSACSQDTFYDFDTRGKLVRIHYADTGQISGFRVWNRLVYFEDMHRGGRNEPHWTDLDGIECGGDELAEAFAIGRPTPHMNQYDWVAVTDNHIKAEMPPSKKNYRADNVYDRLTAEWLRSDEPRSELEFPYIIEDSTYGSPNIWVASENREALISEIVGMVENRL